MQILAVELFEPALLGAMTHLNDFARTSSICHAAKPWVTVAVPAGFTPERGYHRRQLEAILPLCAALAPRYRLRFHAEGPIAPALSAALAPTFSDRRALRDSLFVIVLASRLLALELRDDNPRTALIASDPCSFNRDKWRLYWPTLSDGTIVPVEAALRGKTTALFLSPSDDAAAAKQVLIAGQPKTVTLLVNGADWETTTALESLFPGAAIERLEESSGPLEVVADAIVSTTRGFVHFLKFTAKDRFLELDLTASAGSGGVLRRSASPGSPERDYLYKGQDLNYLKVVDRFFPAIAPAAPRARRVDAPLVSIVVPVYDRTSEIERLAESILQQSYQNLEAIFVANGSPPETLATLAKVKGRLTRKRMRVELVSFPQAFGSATIPRDVGIYRANGDFLCFVDTDDWFSDGFFDVLRTGAALDTIYYPRKYFHDFGRKMPAGFPYHKELSGIGSVETGRLFTELKNNGNFFANSGIIAPRLLIERVHGIWHRLKYAEDYYLWLALAKAGAAAHEQNACINIALHPANNELKVADDSWVKTALERAESGELVW
jgi:hypothetical protein